MGKLLLDPGRRPGTALRTVIGEHGAVQRKPFTTKDTKHTKEVGMV
jgi:hypothetical protein